MAIIPTSMAVPEKPKTTPTQYVIPGANVPQQPGVTNQPMIPGSSVPQAPKPFDESYRNQDAAQQFQTFQSNPDIAKHEYGRINDKMNMYQATGDTAAYNNASNWMNQFNTATGGAYKPVDPAAQQYNDFQKQQNEYMDKLKSFAQPMNYNPATDPQAIAYKQYYDNLAKQGSQNAMESMNSRGLLNSSMTAGEVAKAEQDAGLQYGTKVADLGQQFYQRQQDQFNNTARIADILGNQQQRGLENQHWNQTYGLQKDQFGLQKQGQEFNQGLESNKFNYQQLQDQVKNGQWDKNFDLEMSKFAQQNKLDWATLDMNTKKALASIAIEQRNSNISAMNAGTSAARLSWDQNPNNPDNLYKNSMIEKNGALTNKYDGQAGQITPKLSTDNFNMILDDLGTPGVTKEQARALAQANRDHLTDSDYNKLMEHINKTY